MHTFQNETVRTISASTENPAICLSINRTTILRENSSISISNQVEIIMFMALQERIPLQLLTPDISKNLSELVYIEGIDFQNQKLTIRHLSSSSSSQHHYIHEDKAFSQNPCLLLTIG